MGLSGHVLTCDVFVVGLEVNRELIDADGIQVIDVEEARDRHHHHIDRNPGVRRDYSLVYLV